MDESGAIKFHCHWIQEGPLPEGAIRKINRWRDTLYALGVIGATDEGIGYGNLSARVPSTGSFIITGSGTGTLAGLDGRHYTQVTAVDIGANALTCRGPVRASSESMSHAAVYLAAPDVDAVVHTHDKALWAVLLDTVPTTDREALYGTPELARDILRLFRETSVREEKVIVMGGHEEGIITFGRDLEEAGTVLLERRRLSLSRSPS